MASLAQMAIKNPKVFGGIVGAVIGLSVGLIVDILLFHHDSMVRGIVIGAVVGGALGYWQHKVVAAQAVKLLLRRTLPL